MNTRNCSVAVSPSILAVCCFSATLSLLSLPAISQPATESEVQDRPVDEVVVTGSFIRNSQFTASSPVISISQDDIRQSGAANLGEYLRDMPMMENIDTVANILDAQSGQQDSNGARINLRGLGTESTLTLVDGLRAVNPSAVASLLPGIAQRSVEIVTDGGSALYGSDAVAGVANLIPYKEFDGIRGRVYHKRDQEGDTEQYTAELMTGLSFGSGVNWVGAFEFSKRTPLLVAERPRFLEYYQQTSTSGWPGGFKDFDHNGFFGGGQVRDPDCGVFNEGKEDRSAQQSFPSGVPGQLLATIPTPRCELLFGEWQDYGREAVNYTLFNNVAWDITDRATLELQMSHNYRESNLTSSPSNAVTAQANLDTLLIPAGHPANPFGRDLKPTGWRPFGKSGNLPSHVGPGGAQQTSFQYYTDTYKLGGEYRIGESTWVGETWVSHQTTRRTQDTVRISLSRMQAALRGEGGPGGDQWFNPFASADPRSPNYQPGVTDNSQELVDWLHIPLQYRDDQDRLKTFDTVFSGELLSLPAGVVRAAAGIQFRHLRAFEFQDELELARDDLNQDISAPLDVAADRDSGVRAVFGELEIPVMANLGIKAAVRHEDFYTLGFSSTKPKVAVLWEPLDTLAMRASYGESFLAPSASQLRPAVAESCVEVTDGEVDPLTGQSLNGVQSCSSGNPDVEAEESTIYNVGFTWLPLDELSLSIDYQEIEYVDKIGTLISNEVAALDFNNFLAATNRTAETFDPEDPEDLQEALQWVENNPNPLVRRDGDGVINTVIRAPVNQSSQWVEGFDVRANYGFILERVGRFNLRLSGNYYTRWEYQQNNRTPVINARGKQNGNTGFAPPLPEYKVNLTASWLRGNHSASLTTRYIDRMEFDEQGTTEGFEVPDYIRAITRVDARYSYRFELFGSNNRITVGLVNLFDREAQRLPMSGGLETRIDDPFGRQFHVSMDMEL